MINHGSIYDQMRNWTLYIIQLVAGKDCQDYRTWEFPMKSSENQKGTLAQLFPHDILYIFDDGSAVKSYLWS